MNLQIDDPQNQIPLVIALATILGVGIGWFLATFRASSRRQHAESRIAELREGNRELNDNVQRLQKVVANTQGMSEDIDERDLALDEARDALKEEHERRSAAELAVQEAEQAARDWKQQLDELSADRRAIQEQLAASRRAHEDLTERYVALESKLSRTSARASTASAPEPVEAVAAAAASSIQAMESATKEMLRPLDEVAGVRETARLEAMGLHTNVDLVRKCGPTAGLEVVAASTGIPHERLRRWTSIADLIRVNGLDAESAALLHEVGINSIQELSNSDPRDLAVELSRAGAPESVTTVATLEQWINAARLLEPILKA